MQDVCEHFGLERDPGMGALHKVLGSEGFWDGDYGGVLVDRPFGTRTIQAGMQLGVFLLPLRACYLANLVKINLFLDMLILV